MLHLLFYFDDTTFQKTWISKDGSTATSSRALTANKQAYYTYTVTFSKNIE
jgi:hypothetical protein